MGKSCNNGVNHPKFKDLTGCIFGKLTLLEYVKHNNVWKWKCLCECGENTYTRTKEFTKEKPVQSCRKCGYKRMGNTNLLPESESLKNRIFRNYKRGAAARGYSFELSKLLFLSLIEKECYYCGAPPQELKGERQYTQISFKRNGIDRKNNNLGYIESNVVPCCKKCNIAKMDMTEEDYVLFIIKTYKKLNKNERFKSFFDNGCL